MSKEYQILLQVFFVRLKGEQKESDLFISYYYGVVYVYQKKLYLQTIKYSQTQQMEKSQQNKQDNNQDAQNDKKEDSSKQQKQQKSTKSIKVKSESQSNHSSNRQDIILTKFMIPVLYESIFAYTTKIRIDYCSYNNIKADSLILFAFKNHKKQAYPFQQIYKVTTKGNLKNYVNNVSTSDDRISGIQSQIENFESITIVLPEFYFCKKKVKLKKNQEQKEIQKIRQNSAQQQKNQQEQNEKKQIQEQTRYEFTFQIVQKIMEEVLNVLIHYKHKKIVMSYFSQYVSDQLSDFMIRALLNIFEKNHFLEINKVNKKKFQLELLSILCGDKQTFASMRKAFEKNCFEFNNL